MPHQDLDRISGSTRALAVLGYPARHSLSPRIHNAALAAAGLDYCYLALEVRPEDLGDAVRGLRALGFAGISITAPHKETVIPLLDSLTEEARALGAANTAANRDGCWVGTNTDAIGFQRLLEINGLLQSGTKAIILGAGGAARAGLYVLGNVADEVIVLNRTVERAEELLRVVPLRPGCARRALPLEPARLAEALEGADLLVNGTTLGMHPREGACPVPEEVAIPKQCAVVDMIYMPLKTRLLERAEQAGAIAMGGLDMLLHQAVAQFRFWTGVEPDVAAMEGALRAAVAQMLDRGRGA